MIGVSLHVTVVVRANISIVRANISIVRSYISVVGLCMAVATEFGYEVSATNTSERLYDTSLLFGFIPEEELSLRQFVFA